tara:strand:+ start:503 stop:1162 length:660 start_codon:yes stop_codon:yes gene_type:complete
VIGKLFKIYLDFIRSFDFLTEKIWNIKIRKKLLPITYDLTSLVIKKAIETYIKKNFSFKSHLDMGCGQIAILGQFHKKINPMAEVVSADIYNDFLMNAKENSKTNKLNIKFLESNMFSNINQKFDLITFNPPYVPLRYKNKEIKYDRISFSGEHGTGEIENFLKEANKFLTKSGIIFLGVNQFYVPSKTLEKIISFHEYQLIDTIKRWPHKCIVLVLKK